MSKPTAPERVPTDRVVPVDTLSDSTSFRGVMLAVMFRFDDVMDPEKLRSSLERLLSRDDWRKLGARFRLNERGRLDYHVPAEFGASRPALAYSHVQHDCDLAEHPLASKLPRATRQPTVLTGPVRGMFDELMQRPDGPKVIADYLNSDEPMIGLHVVSFADATLVSLKWHHIFSDIVGIGALMDAWTLVLQGRDDEVLPLHGADFDATAPIGHVGKTEPYRFIDKKIPKWGMFIFILRYVWELWRYPGESGLVCIPAQVLKDIREEAMAELAADADDGSIPFVSEGDVVSAALVRLGMSDLPRNSKQTVQINMPYSYRHLFAHDHIPAGKALVTNAFARVYAYATLRDIMQKPLSWTAALIRGAIADLGTRGQVEAQLAFERESITRSGQRTLFGDTWMYMITPSNWSKADLFGKDFSAAVVETKKEEGPRSTPRGRPLLVVPSAMLPGTGLLSAYRFLFYIVGKDAEGNTWASGYLRKGEWALIEEGLRQGGRIRGNASPISWGASLAMAVAVGAAAILTVRLVR